MGTAGDAVAVVGHLAVIGGTMSSNRSCEVEKSFVGVAPALLVFPPLELGSCRIVGVVSSGGEILLNLTAKKVRRALGSPRIFQRALHAGWLKPLCVSRDNLFPISRVLELQRRLEAGEFPPLLRSEVRQREARRVSEKHSVRRRRSR
jgi:hypothetical protein